MEYEYTKELFGSNMNEMVAFASDLEIGPGRVPANIILNFAKTVRIYNLSWTDAERFYYQSAYSTLTVFND
jgi:hypothetical protein